MTTKPLTMARLNSTVIELQRSLARRDALLREVVAWKNSDVVQASFKRAAGLALTHPHLGVPVSKEVSTNASAMWERIERELGEIT